FSGKSRQQKDFCCAGSSPWYIVIRVCVSRAAHVRCGGACPGVLGKRSCGKGPWRALSAAGPGPPPCRPLRTRDAGRTGGRCHEEEFMERSEKILQGLGNQYYRATLKSMGFTTEDLKRPVIGIANACSECVPG